MTRYSMLAGVFALFGVAVVPVEADVEVTLSEQERIFRGIADDEGNLYFQVSKSAKNGSSRVYFLRKKVGGAWQPVGNESSDLENYSSYSMFKGTRNEIFTTGWVTRTENDRVASTLRSIDQGETWTQVDMTPKGYKGILMSGDAWNNRVATCGNYTSKFGTKVWFVRESVDFGKTWKTVDEFPGSTKKNGTNCSGVVYDGQGRLVATGWWTARQTNQLVAVIRARDTTTMQWGNVRVKPQTEYYRVTRGFGGVHVVGGIHRNKKSYCAIESSFDGGVSWTQHLFDAEKRCAFQDIGGSGEILIAAGDQVVMTKDGKKWVGLPGVQKKDSSRVQSVFGVIVNTVGRVWFGNHWVTLGKNVRIQPFIESRKL